MPELPLRYLTLALSTKSPYVFSVARNSFFFKSPCVRPTISPSSTVKSALSSGVTQPLRSLPLKSGWNGFASWPDTIAPSCKAASPVAQQTSARRRLIQSIDA